MTRPIPWLIRPLPLQAGTIAVFAIGGLLGMIPTGGDVLVQEGKFQLSSPVTAGIAVACLTALLLLISAFVRPLNVNLQYKPYAAGWGILFAGLYMIAGWALLIFNLIRLDVPNLILENPGEIAFRLTEEHGAVFFYTTMLCFLVGSSFVIDSAKTKILRRFAIVQTILFSMGLLATARREMMITVFAWGFVHLLNRKAKSKGIIIGVSLVFVSAVFVATIVFRKIDLAGNYMAYFMSGEFEPFRFGLWLVDNWISQGGFFYSPWPFAVPFYNPDTLAESTNCTLVQDYLHNYTCLGSYTITVFASILYFGIVPPLVFYVISVWCLRQAGQFLQTRPGPFASFIYAFFLVRLVLFIRNGELFNSVIDTIVLVVLLAVFFITTGWKASFPGKRESIQNH